MNTLEAVSIRSSVDELNDMILQGQILDAFDRFYGENVVMEERGNARVGFEANREFEVAFVNNLTEFRGAEVKAVTVDEEAGVSMVEWFMDYTHAEWGVMTYQQIAVQRWENGKIVHERFYNWA